MFSPTPAPSRATRRRLSRARAVRRAAGCRCELGPVNRPCGSAASGVVRRDGRDLAACYRHLPAAPVRAARTAHDRVEGWARPILARLRRDLAASDTASDDGA